MKNILGYKQFESKIYQDMLVGGRGDKLKPEDVNQEELKVGVEVEREHVGGDAVRAAEIAIDHLSENPNYYSDLISSGMVDEEPALEIARSLGWIS